MTKPTPSHSATVIRNTIDYEPMRTNSMNNIMMGGGGAGLLQSGRMRQAGHMMDRKRSNEGV
jgi:hypothetical protein